MDTISLYDYLNQESIEWNIIESREREYWDKIEEMQADKREREAKNG